MSEKPSRRAVRALGAHPDRIPPPLSSGLGLDGKPFTGRTVSHRRTMLAPKDQTSITELTSPTSVKVPEPLVFYGPEKPHLERWFKKGTRIYSLGFTVPRTLQEARDRLVGTTEEAAPQDIDMDNLVWSYRLKRWREQPKKEHKTKRFGAFVKVNDVTVINRRGEKVTISGFGSLNDLQKEEDNPLARFKKATS